jgi:hypothetical protein
LFFFYGFTDDPNIDAFEFGTSPDLAFAGPFVIEGAVGGTLPASNATTSSSAATTSPSPVAAAPGSNTVASPAAPATTATSSTTAHNANASSSATNNQVAGQAVVALGLVVIAASQFF